MTKVSCSLAVKGRFYVLCDVFSPLWGRRLEALLQPFSSVPLFVGRENEADLWCLPAFLSLPFSFMEFLVLYWKTDGLEYSFRCCRNLHPWACSEATACSSLTWGTESLDPCELLADRRIPQATESHHLRLEQSKRLRKLRIAGGSGNGTRFSLLWYSSPAICSWLLSETHTGLGETFCVTSHHLSCSSLGAVLILLTEHWGVQGCVPDASSGWKLPLRLMPGLERGWLEVCDCDKALQECTKTLAWSLLPARLFESCGFESSQNHGTV